MSHTAECRTTRAQDPASGIDQWNARCDCFEPDTDWSPEKPCGGTSVNGAEPPLCEVHMKPWGHRRLTSTPAETTDGAR